MIHKIIKNSIRRQIRNSLSFMLPEIKVKVNQGIVKGVIESLPDGRKFQRFSGIPYAKPPIGKLRFRAPQKLMKFDKDEIDCSKEGNQCVHKSLFYNTYVGSEDCLNLNVYVPNDNVDKIAKLPVMVFTHGGAFAFGSNNRDLYSPEFLLMEDVIVVTINYRLHFLGFASIPEMGIYGNAGLKDQQMALEWIFENIGNFGGDQKNVTMFGNSSGAIMVHLQSLNSKSRQYFQKMILHNCSTLCDYAIQSRPEEKTKRVVQILKGRFDTPKEIYESLMKIDAKDLFKYRLKCQEAYEKRRRLEMIIKPSIEVESDEAFLTKSPIDIIREKHLNSSDMPIMIGICNGEGLFHSNYAIKNIKELNDKISDLIPPMLNIEYGSKEYLEFGNEMRSFYFGTKGLTRETFNSYPNLSHDLHFSIPLTMFNETYREYYPHSKQFVFEFCIESKLNYIKPHSNVKHLPGVFHSDEMSYLFDQQINRENFSKDSIEWKYREMICKMWSNFAKFSNPTPDNTMNFKWLPIDDDNPQLNYLKITNQGNVMNRNLYEDRIQFWRKIFQKYNGCFRPHHHTKEI